MLDNDSSGEKPVPSLQESCPEQAKWWHPTRNGDLTPDQVPYNWDQEVWWQLNYTSPKTGKTVLLEWETTVCNIAVHRCGLPRHVLIPGFNDLGTTYPQVVPYWHPTRNGDLTPRDVTAHSARLAWWLYPYDDPITGKHFDFEWSAAIDKALRAGGDLNCPYLTGHAFYPGFNDLQTRKPHLAAYWHPTRNGELTPRDVHANSTQYFWWLYPYDDPRTGKHFDFEWPAVIGKALRADGKIGCPYLAGRAVYYGFNDLETQFPSVASEWDYTKNNGVRPSEVYMATNTKYYWRCPECGASWYTSVSARTRNGSGCPFRVRKWHP